MTVVPDVLVRDAAALARIAGWETTTCPMLLVSAPNAELLPALARGNPSVHRL